MQYIHYRSPPQTLNRLSYLQPENLLLPVYIQVSEMFTSRYVFLLG